MPTLRELYARLHAKVAGRFDLDPTPFWAEYGDWELVDGQLEIEFKALGLPWRIMLDGQVLGEHGDTVRILVPPKGEKPEAPVYHDRVYGTDHVPDARDRRSAVLEKALAMIREEVEYIGPDQPGLNIIKLCNVRMHAAVAMSKDDDDL